MNLSQPSFAARPLLSAVAFACAVLVSPGAAGQPAQPSSPLRDAAQAAVQANPEVMSRWHAIKAAESERNAARGGFLPRVDLSAAVGPQRRSDLTRTETGTSATLAITQLLWDGMATSNEVKRLDHAARVRLFEFFDISETTALEAARAYLDVRRYRDLVKLAEDNFVEHRAVFGQTERRVNARIARAVDLEQVTGRLALAEANLLTETANLHDTSARYQRIVGRTPPAGMPMPPALTAGIPNDPAAAVTAAQRDHAGLRASVESVRAAQAALATRKAAYQPRLDLRLRHDHGTNLGASAIPGASNNLNTTAAEVVLSWNLFNGFSDVSREKQFAEQLNITQDLRDKTCRDVRQTVMIAHNDIRKLANQLTHLELHEAALGRALVAYRQQFDLGQRSLLDLLDTENELFQARRAVVNARHDLALAQVRTHAGMGNLLRALELRSMDPGETGAVAVNWDAQPDAAHGCPVEPITVQVTPRDELMRQVTQRATRPSAAEPAASAPAAAAAPAQTAAPVPLPAPTIDPAAMQREVRAELESWRQAWAARNVDAYLSSYAPGFTPAEGLSRTAWEKQRRSRVGGPHAITVEIAELAVSATASDRVTTRFTQRYESGAFKDVVKKSIDWVRVGGQWKIVRETSAKG